MIGFGSVGSSENILIDGSFKSVSLLMLRIVLVPPEQDEFSFGNLISIVYTESCDSERFKLELIDDLSHLEPTLCEVAKLWRFLITFEGESELVDGQKFCLLHESRIMLRDVHLDN